MGASSGRSDVRSGGFLRYVELDHLATPDWRHPLRRRAKTIRNVEFDNFCHNPICSHTSSEPGNREKVAEHSFSREVLAYPDPREPRRAQQDAADRSGSDTLDFAERSWHFIHLLYGAYPLG